MSKLLRCRYEYTHPPTTLETWQLKAPLTINNEDRDDFVGRVGNVPGAGPGILSWYLM